MVVVSNLVHYDTLLQNATRRLFYYKCGKRLFQNEPAFLLQTAAVLLQNVTVIAKCDDFIKKCNNYHKMQRLLQNAPVHTSFK